MSSHAERHGHLDATAGREVVYCHACANEWYRDEGGLICPECHGEITEIIDSENDPRDFDHRSSASTSPEIHHYDSDPEEADIDEHTNQGFVFRRSVRDGSGHHHHHDPAYVPTFESFVSMLNGFGARAADGNRSFPQGPGEHGEHQEHGEQHQGQDEQGENREAPQQNFARVQRATFAGPFGHGRTTITMISTPVQGNHTGPPGVQGIQAFQEYAQSLPRHPEERRGLRVTAISLTIGANQRSSIFSDLLRDVGAPPPGHANDGQPGVAGDPARFGRGLQDLLNLLTPGSAVHGDAVYSQEALDRIITGLMEANPQSNAAPPASEEALRNLERKPVNKEMLGSEGKAECTICIDEMKEGDMATFLPCSHWFHEECVTLWLKEHNTCPICRTPIEKNDRGGSNTSGNNGNNQSQGSASGPSSERSSPFTTRASSAFNPGWEPSTRTSQPHSHSRPAHYSRPPSHSQSRLNEVLRNISTQREERDRESSRERDRATTSGYSYDTSRLQRRSSHSPTSPRARAPSEHGAQMRQRSPSQSSRRSMAESYQQPSPPEGRGYISWLQRQFSRRPGSGSPREPGPGSPRDESRQ
ncbi:ring finger [Fusarium longipes]|uniref:RING-type E3 ubiquitin transferase n=1 Tax=Fusarium longipes TaxID=694270 RepID=A0A395SWD1_9HYPO|nr:ring finger [Fusarium longipes]